MKKLNGWAGKVLHVDLTDGSFTQVPTEEYEPEKYIGGIGLNYKIFWDLGCPKVAAFDPENPLIIGVGPLTGVPGPFGRAEVCSISPQSYPDELFTYSGFGGKWPSELKYAGYDAVVVVGKAEKPVYVSIHDQDVKIMDASHLWGLDTHETQRVIMQDDPDTSVVCMGRAGENLSRNAVMVNETGNTAGQGGFGAVMGSKNLKAIAVHGTGGVNIAKPDELMTFIAERKAKGEWFTGASNSWARSPYTGEPVESEMVEKYRKKINGCFGCPYQCNAFYDMPGVGKGTAMCASWWYAKMNQDAKATWEAVTLAQRLGINHFDLYGIWEVLKTIVKEKLLTKEEWNEYGLPPIPHFWGGDASDHEFNTALMQGIAEGSSLFAEGGARGLFGLLEKLKDRDELKNLVEVLFPIHGQPAHYFGWLGWALLASVDTRDSADSSDAIMTFAESSASVFEEGGDPVEVARDTAAHFGVPWGKSNYAHAEGGEVEAVYDRIEEQVAWTHRNHSLKNALTMCNFASLPDQYFDPPEMDIRIFESQVFSMVTGVEMDVDELWKAGDRIWTLRRAVGVMREGRTRKQDTLQDAMFDTVWSEEHPATFEKLDTQIDRQKFEALKGRYYDLCGWSVDKGWPTRETLEKLDMVEIADELERDGLLG
jgi:aldehyde:ferredoxin oxidoreductase